jgi:hypothetical protein
MPGNSNQWSIPTGHRQSPSKRFYTVEMPRRYAVPLPPELNLWRDGIRKDTMGEILLWLKRLHSTCQLIGYDFPWWGLRGYCYMRAAVVPHKSYLFNIGRGDSPYYREDKDWGLPPEAPEDLPEPGRETASEYIARLQADDWGEE